MKHALTALALLASLPAPVLAETNGTLGASSTGSLKFSLNVTEEKLIQISGLEDFIYKTDTETPLLIKRNTVCVHMPQPSPYSLTITAEPLMDSQRSYTYYIKTTTTGGSFSSHRVQGSKSTYNPTIDLKPASSSPNCNNSSTFGLEIRFDRTDSPTKTGLPATSGTATAILTLVVAPL